MIDPLRNRWGTGTTFRYAKGSWVAPAVDLEALAGERPDLATWVRDRRVPKVMVATQTPVLEVVADPDGRAVPSTPVISVEVAPDDVWLVTAALSSPAASAHAWGVAAGTGLSPRALKVSATQVLEIPLPTEESAWRLGAELAQEATHSCDGDSWGRHMRALGEAMDAAYETPGLVDWWVDRLPPFRP